MGEATGSSKVAKGSAIILIGNVIFRVGGYLYRFLMASLLGPAAYGILGLCSPNRFHSTEDNGLFRILLWTDYGICSSTYNYKLLP